MPMTLPFRPEILAPAGDRDCMKAALAAGADAVYFGLDEGFNARARATNFPVAQLREIVEEIHRGGARAYLALNTLIFESELESVEVILRAAARAGVDALIVQDPAVCLLARAVCPELELHASTQMTISSPEGVEFAETLGITRVVLPRELSLDEIARVRAKTSLELEVFIAGALCVSWSGQCLSSEAWGGRSANRGQCAQACRLPYDLMVDGEHQPLGDVSFLLSPQDLAGFRSVERLMELGIHTLKVEGRQKDPKYVFSAVTAVREWVEALAAGQSGQRLPQLQSNVRDLNLAYSRGFGEGFFQGSDHQHLVEGKSPRHRGLLLGRAHRIEGRRVWVERVQPPEGEGLEAALSAELQPVAGMGVLFVGPHQEAQENLQGGPIFEVTPAGSEWILGFGQPGPNLGKVTLGSHVWVTSDPAVARRVQRHLNAPVTGGNPVRVRVWGSLGMPLQAAAQAAGCSAACQSEVPLQAARAGGLQREILLEKLATFGGSSFELDQLDCSELQEGLFVPVSELKRIRKVLLEQLELGFAQPDSRAVRPGPQLPGLRTMNASILDGPVKLVPLCRKPEHLEAAIEAGVSEVILDWMELVGLRAAAERARAAGLKVTLATVRVQKPGEEAYDRRLDALVPERILARHWAAVMHFSRGHREVEVEGDFSLNVTNGVTANHLLSLGLDQLTAAHDLDERQLVALLARVPRGRVGVILHHHIPTFHTEHCVYSHLLSEGKDYRTCGRPCEQHQVGLRDRKGLIHPVVVDVGCRNTVFNARAQSAASLVPVLRNLGVLRFRVEFVWENQAEARQVLESYSELLAGQVTAPEVLARLRTHEQFGVSLGTMQVLSPL
jgi:putative protease